MTQKRILMECVIGSRTYNLHNQMEKQQDEKDFFTAYLDFVDLKSTESPAIYHRWVCASMLGAMMGRQIYLPFGHGKIYPNQYIMLMGSPATKKGTAMKVGERFLRATGYDRFSADKNSKEQFLKGMKQYDGDNENGMMDLEVLTLDAPAECYLYAEEFVDFIGQGDTGFMMMLTKLWDNPPVYKHPKITGKDVEVHKPTVSVLGASTAATFALSFPPEAVGTGFMSRMLLIFAEPTNQRIAWPGAPDEMQKAMIVERMKEMRKLKGEMKKTKEFHELAEKIYQNMVFIPDERFAYYMERRHQHLLKLSMILAISDLSMVINTKHLIRANTMLIAAESKMPKALGEFGASKYSAVNNMILNLLTRKHYPQTATDIWKEVHKELSKLTELIDILSNLMKAEKIQVQTIKGKTGYVPYEKKEIQWDPTFMDLEWLTDYEQGV